MRPTYDYIVVGAGSSGCVVAARLSEDPTANILVLEAGGSDDRAAVHNPAEWPTLLAGELDWGYQTMPQRHANKRRVPCPRGKMIGGCHSHNASAWVHGHPTDFDSWAYRGNPGWDYHSVLPVFRSIEDYAGGASGYRGSGGPLYMELPRTPHPVAIAFIDAARETGLPVVEDNNGADMEGASYFNLTIKDGRRNSVASAYLRPALDRPNLTVVTEAETRRLILEGTRCRGVEYAHDGRLETASADREVIVCAGAIGSPRLLMLSGIGPSEELAPLGIPPVVDLPGVGRNLQDHALLAGICYEAKHELPPPRNNGMESTLWWKSDWRLLGPDLQPVILEFPFATAELAPQVPPNGYTIAPALVRPASRGRVRLTASSPAAPLEIDMNYLEREADVMALLVAIDLCREIGGSSALRRFCKREVLPGPRDRAAMREFIRQSVSTFFDPAGTCRMGVDAMAVVDAELRVFGVVGLRVADASVMPDVTTGNTNAPSVLIGEKAAAMAMGARAVVAA
jgi:choline dehydrogenase-like flavoprotein